MTILDQSLTKAPAIDDRAIDGDLVVVLEVVHGLLVDELVHSHLATNLGGPKCPFDPRSLIEQGLIPPRAPRGSHYARQA